MAASGQPEGPAQGEVPANPAAVIPSEAGETTGAPPVFAADATLSFEYEPEHSARAVRFVLDAHREIHAACRREQLARIIRAVPEAVALFTLCLVWVWRTQPDSGRFAVVLGAVLLVPYLMYRSQHGPWWRFRDSMEADSYDTTSESRKAAVTVRIQPHGVEMSGPLVSSTFGWASIERAVRSDAGIVLLLANRWSGFFIPFAAFPSSADADRWVSQLRERHEASGHGFTAHVQAALGEADVRCGTCGYFLNGIKTTTCPECGTGLTSLRIMTFRYLQLPLRALAFGRGGAQVPGRA